MKPVRLIWAIPVFAAVTAFAHEGVRDPQVAARMNAMTEIAAQVKILGMMAKGETDFDRDKARAAAASVADHAKQSVALFEPQADDPKSEALPVIWENYADFTLKSNALETAASTAAAQIETENDVRQALQDIGQTCSACHKLYRK